MTKGKFISASSLSEAMLDTLNQCEKTYFDELSSYGSGLSAIKSTFLEGRYTLQNHIESHIVDYQLRQSVLYDLNAVRIAKKAFVSSGLENAKNEPDVVNIIHELSNKYPTLPFKCSDAFKGALSELAKELAANEYTDNISNDSASIDLVVYDQTRDVEFHG